MTTTSTGASVFSTGQIATALGVDRKLIRNWVIRGHVDPEFGIDVTGEYLWGHGDVSILRGIRPLIACEFPSPVVKSMTERVRELRRAGTTNHEIVIFTAPSGTHEARLNGSVGEMMRDAAFGYAIKFPALGEPPK